MNRLDRKAAVITGATSGMGEASAKRFAEAGAKVVIAGRNEERGRKIETDILEKGGEAVYFHLDVSDEEAVKVFMKRVLDQYGKLDILFNNAGIFPATPPLEQMETSVWNEIMDINATGMFRVTKYAMPYLEENRGVILNNASVAGMQSFASGKSYAYSASKAAVIQFTRMIAKVYGEKVRANCICPGVIDTPIFINRDFSRYYDSIPMHRVGSPEEVAKAANFLVSDDASYINGAVLAIDGGMSV
ncbi:MAG: SDR family oxidoreductase [Lachnospiraceae bacterium]|nr:SDR family oxidoreductase [Lachnospiraceae bacterium]